MNEQLEKTIADLDKVKAVAETIEEISYRFYSDGGQKHTFNVIQNLIFVLNDLIRALESDLTAH